MAHRIRAALGLVLRLLRFMRRFSGIRVCEEWNDFSIFRDWALSHGYAEDLTIERIDNDGNYEPSNCKWITRLAQARNKRNNHVLTIWGETKCVKDWSMDSRCRVAYTTFKTRIERGWDPEKALVTEILREAPNKI